MNRQHWIYLFVILLAGVVGYALYSPPPAGQSAQAGRGKAPTIQGRSGAIEAPEFDEEVSRDAASNKSVDNGLVSATYPVRVQSVPTATPHRLQIEFEAEGGTLARSSTHIKSGVTQTVRLPENSYIVSCSTPGWFVVNDHVSMDELVTQQASIWVTQEVPTQFLVTDQQGFVVQDAQVSVHYKIDADFGVRTLHANRDGIATGKVPQLPCRVTVTAAGFLRAAMEFPGGIPANDPIRVSLQGGDTNVLRIVSATGQAAIAGARVTTEFQEVVGHTDQNGELEVGAEWVGISLRIAAEGYWPEHVDWTGDETSIPLTTVKRLSLRFIGSDSEPLSGVEGFIWLATRTSSASRIAIEVNSTKGNEHTIEAPKGGWIQWELATPEGYCAVLSEPQGIPIQGELTVPFESPEHLAVIVDNPGYSRVAVKGLTNEGKVVEFERQEILRGVEPFLVKNARLVERFSIDFDSWVRRFERSQLAKNNKISIGGEVNVQLPSTHEVTLRVVNEDAEPMGLTAFQVEPKLVTYDANLAKWPELRGGRPTDHPAWTELLPAPPSRIAQSDEGGTLILDNLPMDVYELTPILGSELAVTENTWIDSVEFRAPADDGSMLVLAIPTRVSIRPYNAETGAAINRFRVIGNEHADRTLSQSFTSGYVWHGDVKKSVLERLCVVANGFRAQRLGAYVTTGANVNVIEVPLHSADTTSVKVNWNADANPDDCRIRVVLVDTIMGEKTPVDLGSRPIPKLGDLMTLEIPMEGSALFFVSERQHGRLDVTPARVPVGPSGTRTPITITVGSEDT